MPARLSQPTDVPNDHQPLIDMLWRFYVAANGPSTREIARIIATQDDDQRDGTANHETVRRTLKALHLPEWQTVEVIFLALCQIANVDADDEDDGDSDFFDRFDQSPTHRDRLRQCYRLARYGAVHDLPRTRDEKARQQAAEQERAQRRIMADDPWGQAPSAGSGGFADEPPF
ncbi:hypothetical protein ACSHWB_03235 [Lentzea sp. HUAS TT2]|uniref:hypothetical protein n=1 Tax=Lentzea sp. HUAS TT2 TaxID=3447454 RepID=UPI003F722B26